MKVLLITHTDLDGLTPVILSKFVFDDLSYIYLDNTEKDEAIKELIDNNIFDKYDNIFITDLGIIRELCETFNKKYRDKIKIFDHHKDFKHINDYEFGTFIDIDEYGNAETGTSLYYKYLALNYSNEIFKKESVKTFVELVRQYDSWEWLTKYNNILARELNDLLCIYGKEKFINYFSEYLKNNSSFELDEIQKILLEIEEDKIARIIEEKEKTMFIADISEHKVGIVFSEIYKSEIGSTLSRKYKDTVDFIIIIEIPKGVSFRGVNDVDLGEFAKIYDGNGHMNSAGAPLPKGIYENIISFIFKDIKNISKINIEKTASFIERIK